MCVETAAELTYSKYPCRREKRVNLNANLRSYIILIIKVFYLYMFLLVFSNT